MRPVIRIEEVSKLYRLGEIGTGTLSHDLNRWYARVRGKEDPFALVGTVNDRTKKDESQYAWALKDISFEVEQGSVVGIIGRNGAGKSTLLKLLSRVTTPTRGEIYVKGRIASLLEVGTGFHPELTGRENIFLNGAILGMSKAEIRRKFDEIVDFSGVERYIETPVKRYSSGMYVRLAFAVAAHLESEILIVDEVLAVGDMEFQRKCLGKMGDVSRKEGRTVLFVSHNMPSMLQLCNRGILMDKGQVVYHGDIETATRQYFAQNASGASWIYRHKGRLIQFTRVEFLVNGKPESVTSSTDSVEIRIHYQKQIVLDNDILSVSLTLFRDGVLITNLNNDYFNLRIQPKESGVIVCHIPQLGLRDGKYSFNLYADLNFETQDHIENVIEFENIETNVFNPEGALNKYGKGVYFLDHSWELAEVQPAQSVTRDQNGFHA